RALPVGCPFRAVTGLDCPGCGATRALYALTQGDVLRAVDHNVFAVALVPLLAWAWVGWLRHRLDRRPTPPTLAPVTIHGIAIAIAVFWVVRNLPGMAWLASSPGFT
ncbi:MAG: DUF2752 domain-containing protein, partial [Nitriliruptoraceae bacterium]